MSELPTRQDTESSATLALSAADKQRLLRLARRALETCVVDGSVPEGGDVSGALLEPRATFVTLRRRDSGELRGCRGEYVARRPLVESVIHMTVVSATDDPRFPPVQQDEVAGMHIEISVLTPPAPIEPTRVVVGRHGLIIRKGRNAGLLLPQVPLSRGWNRDEYLDAVCWKAGLPPGAWRDPGVELQAFEAEVWGEES